MEKYHGFQTNFGKRCIEGSPMYDGLRAQKRSKSMIHGEIRSQRNLTWPSVKELDISFLDLLICVEKSCDHVDGT